MIIKLSFDDAHADFSFKANEHVIPNKGDFISLKDIGASNTEFLVIQRVFDIDANGFQCLNIFLKSQNKELLANDADDEESILYKIKTI